MLVKIREKSKGIVAYFLVALIAIAFSLWGMDSLFDAMRGDPNEVARVNKTSISQFEVERFAQIQARQLQEQNIPLDMQRVRQFALNMLIQEQLISQATQKYKFHISERQLDRYLVRMRVFQDEQGHFHKEGFVSFLRQEGLTAQMFRDQLRQDLLNQQLLGGLAASEFSLPVEVDTYQKLAGEARSYKYKVFKSDDYLAQVKLNDEEIESFYERHKSSFLSPERLQVNYVMFDPAKLKDDLTVSDADLENAYQARIEELQASQRNYEAAHILLTFKDTQQRQAAIERLNEVKAQVLAGASFADLAAEISEDLATAKRGGLIGAVQAGSGLDVKFEEALFNLAAEGDVSDPVDTAFGVHLIQLVSKISEAETPSFASLKPELEERAKAQLLRVAVSEKIEELRNLSFSTKELTDITQVFDLQVQTSDWLERDKLSGIWAEGSISQAIFDEEFLNEGWLTEPLSLADGRYLVAGKSVYEPQYEQSLDEVKTLVEQGLRAQKAADLARTVAQQELEDIQAGKAEQGTWLTAVEVERFNQHLPRDINMAAFRLGLQDPLHSLALANGNTVLIHLQSVIAGKPSNDATMLADLSYSLQQDLGRRLQTSLVFQLEQNAKIVVR